MNIVEFADLVDYRLSQMASRNEHHQFERLCSEIARRRIATNMVVATGPVSSGGDGGRDAESFDSSLPVEVSTWFSLRATTAAVAIACSLEKNYSKKIRNDVERIDRTSDRRFDRIVFFSGQAIPVAASHKLQNELSSENCTLAIWDRPAMARALSDPDLHWAAQHYLSIPAELVESLHPADGLDLPLEDEIYYLPGQALVRVIEHALSVSQSVDPEARGEVLKEWRQYVALHVALDRLPLTSQHAYELSRQSDELARRLHRKGTSGAEALRAYGLLR